MNKIIVLVPIFFCAVKASFAQPGKLDSSFGVNGITKTDLGSVYNYGYEGRVILVQPDGSMYFVMAKSGITLIKKNCRMVPLILLMDLKDIPPRYL